MKFIFFILAFYQYANQYIAIEQNIICEKYEEAYKGSISTIKTYKNANWKIVFNALLLADSLHNYSEIDLLSFELGRRGGCIDFLKSFAFYEGNKEIVDSSWEVGNHIFLENYKEDFLDSLIVMFERDQVIRENALSNKNSLNNKLIFLVDSLNMNSFQKLVKRYGFPNEFIIGLNCYKGDEFSFPYQYLFRTMFRHFSLRNFKSFRNIIDIEFLAGRLDLYEYTHYIQTYHNPKPPYIVRRPFHRVESKYYKEKFSQSNIDSINLTRKIYGLPSFQEQLNLYIYTVKHPSSKFRIHAFGDILPKFPRLMKALTEINIDNEIPCINN